MKKLLFLALVGVFVFAQFGTAFGDLYYNVEIDESIENAPPTVNVYQSSSYGGPSDGANVTASKVSILSQLNEYLQFTLNTGDTYSLQYNYYMNLWEDQNQQVLSDRLGVTYGLGTGYDIVTFWSDGANPSLLPTGIDLSYEGIVPPTLPAIRIEDGTMQFMWTSGFFSGSDLTSYTFLVKSDAPVTEVPEPTTTLLLCLGLAGIAGIRRRLSY
jgi:hypothetical protein